MGFEVSSSGRFKPNALKSVKFSCPVTFVNGIVPSVAPADASVTVAKIAAGALAATTAGRAKMATNFFDEATAADKFTINTLNGDRLKDGSVLIAKLGPNGQGFYYQIADPGNGVKVIPVANNGRVDLVSVGSETRTLADPSFAGQYLLLAMKTDGGDIVLATASACNQTGNNRITFNDAGDMVTLVAIYVGSALKWRIMSSDGVALSTV